MATKERTRLTVDLPKAIVEQADALVRRGIARSRNRLIQEAVTAYLKQPEENAIDARFAEMEHDDQYRDLSLKIADEFAHADWETLHLEDKSDRS